MQMFEYAIYKMRLSCVNKNCGNCKISALGHCSDVFKLNQLNYLEFKRTIVIAFFVDKVVAQIYI